MVKKAVRRSGGRRSRRPVMVVLEALGRRWALRILWELRNGPLTFRALREASGGLSPSVLNRRLAELRQLDIVELSDEGYTLTGAGEELGPILLELHHWAEAQVTAAGSKKKKEKIAPTP